MKTIKKKASIISALVTMATIISGTSLSAKATVYEAGWARGTRHISYVETDFYWTVFDDPWAGDYTITNSTADQWAEGFFTEKGGVDRTFTCPIEHHYNCKATVKIGIGKLTYNKTFTDRLAISNNGSIWNLDEE